MNPNTESILNQKTTHAAIENKTCKTTQTCFLDIVA